MSMIQQVRDRVPLVLGWLNANKMTLVKYAGAFLAGGYVAHKLGL